MWPFKKKKERHSFTDSDREVAVEKRNAQRERNRIKNEIEMMKLEDQRYELEEEKNHRKLERQLAIAERMQIIGGDKGQDLTALLELGTQLLAADKQNPKGNTDSTPIWRGSKDTPPSTEDNEVTLSLSDSQIEQYLNMIPKKEMKKLSKKEDDELLTIIDEKAQSLGFPPLDDITEQKILVQLKERFK